ncbi:MAG: hypothetical protein MZV70_01725 [Desulfobacterales bacterium]|nr:hypothetical protein [Desulfobacterales bacterium]
MNNRHPSRLDNDFYVLYIGAKQNINVAKNSFLKEIENIKTQPLDKKELEEAKQKLLGQYDWLRKQIREKRIIQAGFKLLAKGWYNYSFPELINSITEEDIMKTANKYFNDSHIISLVAPSKYVKMLEKEYHSESKR